MFFRRSLLWISNFTAYKFMQIMQIPSQAMLQRSKCWCKSKRQEKSFRLSIRTPTVFSLNYANVKDYQTSTACNYLASPPPQQSTF